MKRNRSLGVRMTRLQAALRSLLPAVLVILPGCTKEGSEMSGNGGKAAAAKGGAPIALRPAVTFTPFDATKATATTEGLPLNYAIYTSAYYTDPEFPQTSGDYFTGMKFTGAGTLWTPATSIFYWPAAAGGNGMDFLAVATDPAVYDLSSGGVCTWAGQDDGFLHGERNVHGVRIRVPDSTTPAEILYATASQKCADSSEPVDIVFHHTQCRLVFRIHANLAEVIRLNKIVVNDACTTGELTIVTHPLVNVTWNMENEEQHGTEVPDVTEETPVLVGPPLTYSITLPPQPRRDITFHFHQRSSGDNAAASWEEMSVTPVYTTTSEALKWEAGKMYIFDVTIKFGEIILVPTVADWKDGEEYWQYVPV